jgi:hypothetical protein
LSAACGQHPVKSPSSITWSASSFRSRS